MIQFCKFNSSRDLVIHRPNMSIDLEQVFEDFSIPTGGSSDVPSPDVDNTDLVGERVRDIFDVVENQKAISELVNIDKLTYSSGASQNSINITPSTSDGGAE